MDPGHKMMQLSIDNFFHWGVLYNNRSGLARAQYALMYQCVLDDYDNAERLYRQVRCRSRCRVFGRCGVWRLLVPSYHGVPVFAPSPPASVATRLSGWTPLMCASALTTKS
jgi:hypothetical protein